MNVVLNWFTLVLDQFIFKTEKNLGVALTVLQHWGSFLFLPTAIQTILLTQLHFQLYYQSKAMRRLR